MCGIWGQERVLGAESWWGGRCFPYCELTGGVVAIRDGVAEAVRLISPSFIPMLQPLSARLRGGYEAEIEGRNFWRRLPGGLAGEGYGKGGGVLLYRGQEKMKKKKGTRLGQVMGVFAKQSLPCPPYVPRACETQLSQKSDGKMFPNAIFCSWEGKMCTCNRIPTQLCLERLLPLLILPSLTLIPSCSLYPDGTSDSSDPPW